MTAKKTLRIWVLEDAEFTMCRLKEALEARFPACSIRFFTTRLAAEAAWQRQDTRWIAWPDVFIVDLLVPDQEHWLIRFVLSRWGLMTPLFSWCFICFRGFRDRFPSKFGEINMVTGRDRLWGGMEFLRSRVMDSYDHPLTRFYIYSAWIDPSMPMRPEQIVSEPPLKKSDKVMEGEIVVKIERFVRENLLNPLRLSIFRKGRIGWKYGVAYVDRKEDQLPELLDQIQRDLATQKLTP